MVSSDAAVQRITTRSVPEQATEELRRAILTGALAPGQKFSLREIANMLGISFIPVRDALRNLESEGLIITRPGRSAIVAPLDLDDLRAVYRLRRTLEPEIAGRSCTLLSDAELDRLEREAASFGDEERSIDGIYDAHREFHLALLEPAMTNWDVRIVTMLWRAAERYIRIAFGRLDQHPEEHARREQAHEDLIAAFRSRDPEAAAQAIHEHLAHNEDLALRALDGATDTVGATTGDGPAAPA